MATDTSKFIPADQLQLEQRPIDMKAPFLLRPIGDDPADKRNWVLKAIEKTGQSVEESLHTWVFGFSLEPGLLWNAMVEEKGEDEARAVCAQTWGRLPEEVRQAARQILTFASDEPPYGLSAELDVPQILERTGRSAEDELVFWNRAFTAHDHQMWQALERD